MSKRKDPIPDIPSQYKEKEKHILCMVVSNKPGALVRIALIFTRRGYNIDNVSTHPLPNQKYSLMTLCVSGDKKVLSQIIKQLNKLIDVVKVADVVQERSLVRELAMFKLGFTKKPRDEVLSLIETLPKTITHIIEQTSSASMILTCVGDAKQLDTLEALFSEYDLLDCVRTGTVLLSKDDSAFSEFKDSQKKDL